MRSPIIPLITFCVPFCVLAQPHIPNLYSYDDSHLTVAPLKETLTANTHNIYKKDRDFVYDYLVPSNDINSRKKIKYYVEPHYHLIGSDTVLCYHSQTEYTPNSYFINTIRLKVLPNKPNDSPNSNQSVLKYEYSNYRGTLKLLSELNGYVEDTTIVSIQPPQSASFMFLGYAPSPQMKLVGSTNTWTQTKNVEANKRYKNLPPLSLEVVYTKVGTDEFYSDGKFVKCQVIKAETKPNPHNIYSRATFLFNEELGFVKMEYAVTIAKHEEKVIFNLEYIEDHIATALK